MSSAGRDTGAPAVERVAQPEHTHIGGQAVLEGVMMRGKYNWAVAVRTPDGEIHVEEHDLGSNPHQRPWTTWPIVRGMVALVDTMALAIKAFSVSAQLAGETEDEQLTEKEVGGVMVFGGVIALLLFMVLPLVVTNFAVGRYGAASTNSFYWNLVDGLLRVLILFGYIYAISRMKDIQRVFAYHGAEHKTIHAYEHGVELEPDSVQKFGTAHVRCGTSFLLMVMIVALVVYMFVPIRAILAGLGVTNVFAAYFIGFAIRLLFLPIIAGLAYEVVRYAGRHEDSALVKVALWPGMQLQKMTTREPEDSMVEVAVAAVRPIIAREEAEELAASGAATAGSGPDPMMDSPI